MSQLFPDRDRYYSRCLSGNEVWHCPHYPLGCGIAATSTREREQCHLDEPGWQALERFIAMGLPRLQKPIASKATTPAAAGWIGDDFKDMYPHVAAFLSQTTWDDGTQRVTGTIGLFVQDGMLKAFLQDKDSGQTAFVTAPAFQALWDMIELGLTDGKLDWRTMKTR